MADSPTVTVERDGHVLLMGLKRPDKRNAFSTTMRAELSQAYALLDDDDLRAGVLFGHGDHFTGGLDMLDVAPPSLRGRVTSRTADSTRGDWTTTGPNPSSLRLKDGA